MYIKGYSLTNDYWEPDLFCTEICGVCNGSINSTPVIHTEYLDAQDEIYHDIYDKQFDNNQLPILYIFSYISPSIRKILFDF